MKLIYIDESGDTEIISQGGTHWFVLTACMIAEDDRRKLEDDLREIKHQFYKNKDVEFKSNFIRYAKPDLSQHSPLKLHDRKRYDELEEVLAAYLKQAPVVLIASAIDKAYYWNRYPSQNPYDAAYMFLLERLQLTLEEEKSLGIVIIDPREGRVEKKFVGDHLETVHHRMRFGNHPLTNATPNIVERLLYSDSQNTIGIQIADLYCYPIYHIFEYDKEPSAYWRYSDVTQPKLRRVQGKLLGYGLKVFSNTTKNGLEGPPFDGRDLHRDRL